MEQVILFATDIDLGTCWLGGSFGKAILQSHEYSRWRKYPGGRIYR